MSGDKLPSIDIPVGGPALGLDFRAATPNTFSPPPSGKPQGSSLSLPTAANVGTHA